MSPDDHGVLDGLRRRGTSRTSLTARPRARRGTFAPGSSAHTRTSPLPHPSSAQPTMDSMRRLARGATRSGGLRCSTDWQACTVQEAASMVRCGSLPALPRTREGCRTPRASKEGRGKRGPTHRHGLALGKRARRSRRARIGRSRSCSRVVDVVAEVDRQWPAQRSGRTPFHPIWTRFGDGRLARGSTYESTQLRVKRHWHPHRSGNLHVTVSESDATRAWRGRLAMEGTLDRRGKRSSRNARMSRSRPTRRISHVAQAK